MPYLGEKPIVTASLDMIYHGSQQMSETKYHDYHDNIRPKF